jgi:hypothetical protein
MKKCNRYIDALEDGIEGNQAAWQDVLVHAGKCSDCSSDMRLRTMMLEMLAETPQPDYPDNLHATIIEGLEKSGSRGNIENGELSWFDRFYELTVQSMEVVIPVACLVMFAFLVQIEREPQDSSATMRIAAAPYNKQKHRQNETVMVKADSESLETVTSDEVNDFLQQLEEFKRNHPDDVPVVSPLKPEIRLVNDQQFWRRP